MPSEEFAELIGIVLGDGNLQSYVRPGTGVATYNLRITGHKEEKDYFVGYVKPLCENVLGMPAREVRSERYTQIAVYGKRVIKIFVQHGIKPGNKITNQSKIPAWVFRKNKYLRACVRGLIDTDGSIYQMGDYVQICFRNHNQTLLKQTRQALKQLGFYVSNISNKKIYISRKAEIRKFFKEIGFSNNKHRLRYRSYFSPIV